VEPDILLVALPDFRLCMKRIQKRLKLDVFENMPFQRKIYDLYERITLDDKEARTIDTGGTLEEVSKKVLDWTLARC
jgi:thymidylate kinase